MLVLHGLAHGVLPLRGAGVLSADLWVNGLATAWSFTAFELPHFVMERRMLLGIKERVGRSRARAFVLGPLDSPRSFSRASRKSPRA